MDNQQIVLVIEDEYPIRKFININLERSGFHVIDTDLGEDGLRLFNDYLPSVVILDLMLPDINGYEICKKIRDIHKETVIIMLTAKGQDMDKIMGLELGADDYIVKPFNPLELVARIRANLRRVTQDESEKNKLFRIDKHKRKIYKNNIELSLSPKEYTIMNLLMESNNKSLNRDEILNYVWGKNYLGDYKTVDVHIRRLREKIEEAPSKPIYIETVWGYGYRWRGEN